MAGLVGSLPRLGGERQVSEFRGTPPNLSGPWRCRGAFLWPCCYHLVESFGAVVPPRIPRCNSMRQAGFEPTTFGSGGRGFESRLAHRVTAWYPWWYDGAEGLNQVVATGPKKRTAAPPRPAQVRRCPAKFAYLALTAEPR